MSDPLDQLRRNLGIRPDAKPKVGIVGEPTAEELLKARQAELEALARGGYDYGGKEQITRALRRTNR